MSVMRQANWLGSMRVDVPHLRALESSIAADFDVLAGSVLAGGRALVVRGFEIRLTGALGGLASALQMNVAGAALLHPQGAEAGTLFLMPEDAADEVLDSTNTKIVGSFTAGSVNYIGLDLRREADETTSDVVVFIDDATGDETPRTVPLARTLSYRIVISTTDFGSAAHICPVAKVTTSATNTVTEIEDARPLYFRLGTGGAAPDGQAAHSFIGGRTETATITTVGAPVTNIFTVGDKSISSDKDWKDAVMTRLWEVGGGQNWFSATSDREIKLAKGPDVIPLTGDNFQWTDGTSTLVWQDLSLVFANSSGWYNDIVDDDIILADGECAYVDVVRSENRTGGDSLIVARASLLTLGSPETPGSRFVIAWRKGDDVYIRDRDYEIGRVINVATNLVQGSVRLKYVSGTPSDPLVLPLDSNGRLVNVAAGGNAAGASFTGHGVGGAGVLASGGTSGIGVDATGTGTGVGVKGTATGAGQAGVWGKGGTAGAGVLGEGTTTGAGGVFVGGNAGPGITATGGTGSNDPGVVGTGDGSGSGVEGHGPTGVYGFGTGNNGDGVVGLGSSTGTGGVGVTGYGSGTAVGVLGVGGGGGAGGHGVQGVTFLDGAAFYTNSEREFSALRIDRSDTDASETAGIGGKIELTHATDVAGYHIYTEKKDVTAADLVFVNVNDGDIETGDDPITFHGSSGNRHFITARGLIPKSTLSTPTAAVPAYAHVRNNAIVGKVVFTAVAAGSGPIPSAPFDATKSWNVASVTNDSGSSGYLVTLNRAVIQEDACVQVTIGVQGGITSAKARLFGSYLWLSPTTLQIYIVDSATGAFTDAEFTAGNEALVSVTIIGDEA